MTVYYSDSPYGMTLGVSGTKQAITSELLQQLAVFTQGGTIPYWVRYQYKVNYIITGGTVASPILGGWGPLDETVDKINATPGLRILLPIQQFPSMYWRIDHTGTDVGYGDPNAVLPRWDDFAAIAALIAQRYGNRIHAYQIGNEEYDIGASGANSGGVLAPVFNAAYAKIKQYSTSPVVLGAVRKLPPGGPHVSAWMNAFVSYVPQAGEPAQAIPDGADLHYYRDGTSIISTQFPPPTPYAADPATTDNSLHPGQATVPSVADEYGIIHPILNTLTSGIPVWNMEYGWDNSNAANAHGSYNGTSIPVNVSRYLLTQMAQSWYAGIGKSMMFTIDQYTDPKALHKQGLTDYANFIAANPQWTGITPPSAYLYQSVDALSFEGAVGTAPDPQWYAIMNPTGSSKAWSISSNQAWLTTSTIGTNGVGSTTSSGLTSGTLTAGQRITLVVNADSTHAGLTTLTMLTGTLTITIGANVSTITVSLWVNPNDATPTITIDSATLSFTGAVNGSNPAGQVVNITNAGNYAHNWYAYVLGSWLSVSTSSGTLASTASQSATISVNTAGLAPGLYTEAVYFALTPFPDQYVNASPPTNPEYVSCTVTLKVTASTAPAVQLSTNAMYFTATASGDEPAAQTFFVNNCTKSAENWTVANTQSWLTLSPTSGTNLPKSGSNNGAVGGAQSTDYTLVTAIVNTTALAAGTYTDTITVTLAPGTSQVQQTITVTYVVTATSATEIISAAPTAVSVTQAQGGPAVVGSTTLTNTGNTTGTYTFVRTYTHGTGWLSITPGTGTALAGSGGQQVVTFTCTPGSLAPDTYTANVVFTLGITTATVTITFNVTTTASGDSPYAMTRYVSSGRTPLTYDSLALFSSFTQGGTIPFYIRYQYSWNLIENAKDSSGNPIYDWGPLDETVDKITSTPGLRFIFNLAYAPQWRQAIDATGKWVGYHDATAILAGGPDMAQFATDVTTRYKSFVQSGQIVLQIGNEEYDTALNGSVGGTILGYTMNYAIPAIKSIVPGAIVVAGSVRPGSHNNGAGTQQWMTNFYTYVPGTISGGTEPAQSLPDVHDFHFYDNSNVVERLTTKAYAPDPTVTDNSVDSTKAVKVPIQGVLSIMSGVLDRYNPNCQIWNLENGYSLPNNSPNNHNNSPSNLPSQQDDYTQAIMVQLWYANVGAKYAVYSMLDQGNDPRALYGTALSDFASFMSTNPQWGATPPVDRLYRSVTALSFEGTPATAPPVQYYSIGNPTTASQSWSVSSNKTWLTSVTVPTNGYGGTGGGATAGTLQPGQWITLKCSANSTQTGLATSSTLSGTLSITFGNGVTKTIAISLWVAPTAASPSLTSASSTNNGPGSGPAFTMAVNGSLPANQTISFKNQDGFDTWWYAFSTCNWFSIDTASGVLAAGTSQNIAISMNSIVSSLAPGTYNESLTISATPFPPTYNSPSSPPVQFITINVKLTVQVAHSPTTAVQLSTGTLLYSAVASGSLPAAQTFYLHNCTNAAEPWTASVGSYSAGASGWLTLSRTASASNLPANGADNGATYPQATDYFVITASVNSTAFSAGTYTATITVTLNPGANQSVQTIAVTYVVTGSSATPSIAVTGGPLSYSAMAGGSNPTDQSVTLTNAGSANGTYTSKITYGSGVTGWISNVSNNSGALTSGGGTQTCVISVRTGSLPAGTYGATITFTIRPGGATAVLNIGFTVSAVVTPANFTVSPSALPFSAIVNGSNPAGQSLTITNTGGTQGTWGATISYTNLPSTNSGWFTLSLFSGVLGVGASQTVSAFADDTNLQQGTYTATLTITGPANTVTTNVTFTINAAPAVMGGALSNLLSLAIQKTQVVKVYNASGTFLGVWRDAPKLTGLRSTMNAADSQVKMVLPRKIDAFGGAGQPGTDNTVVLGNNVQVWLFGPGLPTSGLLKLNGVIDTIEPAIDASNTESVTVTITPYGSVLADHGIGGSLTLTNVDPLNFFTYWFTNVDPITQLGGVTYADPLTLSSACATSSGLTVTYTILNQTIKSVLDAMMLMLGLGWFWRVNPDTSALVAQLSPTAQHILILGQHISTLSGLQDNSVRKNVVRFVGSSGVAATAVSTSGSALPPAQGGIGERLAFYQDSRITDNGSAQIMAQGILSLLDLPLTRMKCRLPDYRGDIKTGLGYDIESINVGDTVSIRDARQVGLPTVWGSFKWGSGAWGQSPGAVFNMIVPVLSIDYQWDFCDIEVGVYQPSLNKQLYQIRTKLQDFTTGFG